MPHIAFRACVLDFADMARRFYLSSIDKDDGTVIWFTLVLEGASQFFVERCRDSRLPFMRDQITRIEGDDLGRVQLDGVSLDKLVKNRLREIREYSGLTPN